MSRATWIVTLALLASVSGVGALFVVQNGRRSTQLSLDLWVAAWQLEQPVSIPVLMAICFVAGFLASALLFGIRAARASRRARRLEQELALMSAGSTSGGSGAWRS